MTGADLLYSDTEEALRDSLRGFFAGNCPQEAILRTYESEPQDFSDVWHTLVADIGVGGLLVPEALGGAGASPREAAVVMEEIGRAVAPVPFLTSAVLATVALAAAGDTDTVAALASGAVTATLAVPLSAVPGDPIDGLSLDGNGLSGRVTGVAGAAEADVLVVPVAGSSGLELHTVSADAPGVAVSPVLTLDMTRPLADLAFSGAESSLVTDHLADVAVATAVQMGAALLASEQLGVAQWCLETTLAYVKQRKQFGRMIGSYQAIKHRLADLWLEVSVAAAAARYAADACTTDKDAALATAVAQAYCSSVAVHAAEECIQLHGGIAITWEHPAHLYLKRAKSDQLAFGTAYRHRSRLAELVDLPTS
jgi:alkylation response protein AidB-like acyl-CoA dehydrogenase